MPEHAVLIRFHYNGEQDDIETVVDDPIIQRADSFDQLEYDGYDIDNASSEITLYFYGQNANEMYSKIQNLLSDTGLKGRFEATLRFGAPDDESAEESHLSFEL